MINSQHNKDDILAYVVDAKTNEIMYELKSGARIITNDGTMVNIRNEKYVNNNQEDKAKRTVLAQVVDYETGQIIDELFRGDKIHHEDFETIDVTYIVCKNRVAYYKYHKNTNEDKK